MALYAQAKFVPIDAQPDHHVVPLNRLGEADRLTPQPLDPRAQPQVLALHLLGVPLARLMVLRVNRTRVSTPIVRIMPGDPKTAPAAL